MGVVECKGKCMTKVGVQRFDSVAVCVCVCVCACACACASARARVRICVRVCERACSHVCVYAYIRARENATAFDDVLKTLFFSFCHSHDMLDWTPGNPSVLTGVLTVDC